MKIRKIICAVDKSASSKQALKFSIQLANKFNSELEVVHIFPLELRMREDYKLSLINELEHAIEYHNQYPIKYIQGIVSTEIEKLSRHADVIVMGQKGEHHTTNYYGSNAAQVIQSVSCPVFLIPDKEVNPKFSKISFATDFKDLKREDRFEALRDIAGVDDSELFLLHVSSMGKILDQPEGEEAIELHEIFQDINHAFVVVENTDIVKGINQHIKNKRPDLLAIMPRKVTKLSTTLSQAIIDEVRDVPIFSFHA